MSIEWPLFQAIYHFKYGPFLHEKTWIWRSLPPPAVHLCIRVASGPWKVRRRLPLSASAHATWLPVNCWPSLLLMNRPGYALLVAACPKLARDPVYDPPVLLGPAVCPSSNFRSYRLGQVWSRTFSIPETYSLENRAQAINKSPRPISSRRDKTSPLIIHYKKLSNSEFWTPMIDSWIGIP